MIIWVVEFSREGHKIRKMDKNKYSQKKLFYFCELASCQKRPNSDFQSQFSMSKVIQIFQFFCRRIGEHFCYSYF